MRTVEEIKVEISKLNDEIGNLVNKRDDYLSQGNEFAFDLMNDRIGESLAQIKSLKWVLNESV